MNVDAGYEAAVHIIGEASSNLQKIVTEEDAKIQIITRLLTEALGWRHSDIGAERKNENGFSDYELANGERIELLIEAKRMGKLQLRTQAEKQSYFKISGPVLKPVSSGISQAANYSLSEGIPLSVVTDGITWIVFLPWVGPGGYKEKEAVVFPTLKSVLDDFTVFFELLSKSHVQRKTFRVIFDAVHEDRLSLGKKLAPPFSQNENTIEQKSGLAFDLEQVFSSFFSNLSGSNDPDMLNECFVESRESRIADFSLERLTRNVLGNINARDTDITKSLSDLVSETVTGGDGQTVFIVGPSGAGKSTFLDRFFARTLSSEIRAKCLVVKIDLLDSTGDPKSKQSWLTEQAIASIEKQLFVDGVAPWAALQGLYHLEYKRRSEGVDSLLYQRDKNAFREKFAGIVEKLVEDDREGYLRRLLDDVVKNRKQLPVLIIDNTDEFPLELKSSVFQYAQALQRHAKHCLLFFPSTDRSAWAFSKTEIFNIYSSRSFFLPTPSPREVFRKRVEYIRSRTSDEKSGREYIAKRGIRIKIQDISAFASVIESVFVEEDYASKQVGELANYNMRKSLELAKRVITSSVLNLEDLVNAYVTGTLAAPSRRQFSSALCKGDYRFYNPGDEPAIFPIFRVDSEIKQSPLTSLRVLRLLLNKQQAATEPEDRYMSIASISSFFDVMSVAEIAVTRSLESLLEAGLIEPYDPSRKEYADDRRVAISFRGIAHMHLAVSNPAYFEQQALTTPIADEEKSEGIRSAFLESAPLNKRFEKVRETFANYLVEEDKDHCQLPEQEEFAELLSTTLLAKWLVPQPDQNMWRDPTAVAEKVSGKIEFFDHAQGFGFVELTGMTDKAYLHARVVEQAGLDSMPHLQMGDSIECDIGENIKGLVITRLRAHKSAESKTVSGEVVRFWHDRRYGFLSIASLGKDAFFHFDNLDSETLAKLQDGLRLDVEVVSDQDGQLSVRRFL